MSQISYKCEVCSEDFPEHHLLQVHRQNAHDRPWVEKRGLPGGGLAPRIPAPRIPPPSIPVVREQLGGPGPTAPTMLGSTSRLSVSLGAGTGLAPPDLIGGPSTSFLSRGEEMYPPPPMITNPFDSTQFTGSSRSMPPADPDPPPSFEDYYNLWHRVATAYESSENLLVPGPSSSLYRRLVEQFKSQGIDPETMSPTSPSGPQPKRRKGNTINDQEGEKLTSADQE